MGPGCTPNAEPVEKFRGAYARSVSPETGWEATLTGKMHNNREILALSPFTSEILSHGLSGVQQMTSATVSSGKSVAFGCRLLSFREAILAFCCRVRRRRGDNIVGRDKQRTPGRGFMKVVFWIRMI